MALLSWAIIFPSMPWEAQALNIPLHDTYLVVEYGFWPVWWFVLNGAVQIWGIAGFLRKRKGISIRNIAWLLFAAIWLTKQFSDWEWWVRVVPNNGWTVYPPLSAIPVEGAPVTATGFEPWTSFFLWGQFIGLLLSMNCILLAAWQLIGRPLSQTFRSARNGNP